MNKKQWLGLGLVTVAAIGLAACGNRGGRLKKIAQTQNHKTDLKAAIITDTGGVDDKSFNQSAWEGLQAWGKENKLKKGTDLTTSNQQMNLNMRQTLMKLFQRLQIDLWCWFCLHDAVSRRSLKNNEDVNYVSIDDVIKDQKNVACLVCR